MELKIEDLVLNDAQRLGVAHGKREIESIRAREERMVPPTNKKWKPIPGWRIALNRFGRWVSRAWK